MCSSRCTWACPHVGFPIRTSPAQAAAHTSPELFAVYRVLHRHLTPKAFTVRPCSFSTTLLLRFRSSRSRVVFQHARYLSCLLLLAMHLVRCCRSWCPTRVASTRTDPESFRPRRGLTKVAFVRPRRLRTLSLLIPLSATHRQKRPDIFVGPLTILAFP